MKTENCTDEDAGMGATFLLGPSSLANCLSGQLPILSNFPYETSSAAAALQNDFKKRYKRAVKGLAAAVANFGCFALHWKALCQR